LRTVGKERKGDASDSYREKSRALLPSSFHAAADHDWVHGFLLPALGLPDGHLRDSALLLIVVGNAWARAETLADLCVQSATQRL
jgi:hypothetical protein